MADPSPAERVVRFAALFLCATAAYAAAPQLSTEEIKLSADVLNSDARNDVHVMSGNVLVTQGQTSMAADQATATALNSDHSRWTFERSVHIKTATGELKSDSASAAFVNGQISDAIVKGAPATFEQRDVAADKQVRGQANIIEYDFSKGTVTLTDNVSFSQNGNQFRGNTLIYHVADERVEMNPGGKQTGRVNITIKPSAGQLKPGTLPAVAAPPKDAGKRENGA